MFYHRSTNNTDYSRQGCAEPIEIEKDGTIKQVEITSCGLNGGPLVGEGTYPAAICCNLTCPGGIKFGWGKGQKYPRVNETNSEVYVCDLTDGTELGYKYFYFNDLKSIAVTTRGNGNGKIEVKLKEDGEVIAELRVSPSEDWQTTSSEIAVENRISAVYLRYVGSEKIDILDFTFE